MKQDENDNKIGEDREIDRYIDRESYTWTISLLATFPLLAFNGLSSASNTSILEKSAEPTPTNMRSREEKTI